MALIIDERIAGGRPQKLPQPPTTTPSLELASQVGEAVARASRRALRARVMLAWARL